jgi:hypothetical protein
MQSLQTKDITPSSLNLYTKNLLRLNDGQPIKNLKFLKDPAAVLEKISKYSQNTQRTYIISIVSLLKQDPKQKKLYDQYYKILLDFNNKLKNNTGKSDKQTDNWISQDDVLNKQKELMQVLPSLKTKITPDQYYKLVDLLILSLYTLQAPRRNLDYLKMNVVNKYDPSLSTENNYLDLKNKQFIFRNYKTKKTYTDQVVPISDELYEIIKIYLKYHPLKALTKGKFNIPLLVDGNNEPLKNSNEITRILNKIFSKKIGSSMLRNIYLTDKYSNKMDQLNDDTTAMGTSVNTAQTNYIKTN